MTKDTVVKLVEALGAILTYLANKYLGGLVATLVTTLFLAFQPYFIAWLVKLLGIEMVKYFRSLR